MRPSRVLASLGLLLLVPVCVGVAVLGHDLGYYPYAAAPFVVAAAVVVATGGLFALLPRLRRVEARLFE